MTLGPVPDYLKLGMHRRFLARLKDSRSLDTYELDLFRWFRTETEETWDRMDSEEQRYIEEQVISESEEINDSGVLAVDYYRKRMRSSHVIFLASLLEGSMKRECDRITLALGEQILFKPSELKGDPWSIRKTFIEKYGSFVITNNLWAPIQALLSVRNALVHHSGETSLLTEQQIRELGKIDGVTVDAGYVGIDVSFIDAMSKSVQDLMEFIHSNTNDVIDRAIKPRGIK